MALFYETSGIRILLGDCVDLMSTLADGSVDFVLTDPPYLVDYKGRWDGDKCGIVGDIDPSWVRPAFAELYRVLRDDSFAVTFYGWPHADVFVGTFKGLGFRPVSHLAFVKNVWGLGRFTRGQHETALLLAKGRPPIPKSGISDVFEWAREPETVHPNQKPLCAMRKVLATYAPAGGTVLDPFMGSGPVLRAAKDLGMRAIGIDIEVRWCRYAAARLAQGVLFT
jgi:adenine-specific DNA-methyltransferase